MTVSRRIFLGHASEDKLRVMDLYLRLKAEGFEPWLDEEDLMPGQEWATEIPKAIESAAIFLACLSKTSIAKRGYVQREFRYALSACGNLPPNSIYLIPIKLDDCEVPDHRLPGIERNFRDYQWIDLFDERGFERLVAAIRSKVRPEESCGDGVGSFVGFGRQDLEVFRSVDEPWCPEMVLLPAGSFMMGTPDGETYCWDHEKPQHEVTISQPFALGRYAVTFEEYDYFCEATDRDKPDDCGWGRGRHPVLNVSHDDALDYCAWLSKVTGGFYRLPTEAQWEYACRAGTKWRTPFGHQVTAEQVNCNMVLDFQSRTAEVGSYPANRWGLHEMLGNVYEWVLDGRRIYSGQSETDPQGPIYREDRVARGGCWMTPPQDMRTAYRTADKKDKRHYTNGFRCAGVQKP